MYMRYLSVTIPSWASAILATPLQGPDGQTIELSKAPNLTTLDLLLPSNASIQDLNASSGNGLDIRCDGARYGFNPSLSDCEGARSYIPPDSEQYVFGERHTGLPTSTFPLPYIIMGDKAECFFQAMLIGGSATARASLSQIRNAASALFLTCASNDPSQGGIVSNIGGDNNIAVVMGVFEPKVQCRGNFDTSLSCRDILADMPATTELEVFGPHDAPFVKEMLPLEVASADNQCILRLFSTGRSDVVAWYRIWEAVEATFAMCGRFLEGGVIGDLVGQQGNVFLTLGARSPTVSTGNWSDDATA
ncbi:hypothetical protein HO173_000192 [Letharia columbiana]|uniref:Uncharacterized protein n=1 Tax=Letharia columbiana TaxID=112416 RepID=A0A8H6LAE4_9LECA|nr:uncharacterized protein HO173_000192 [Letharia columbiana]KAF6241482.1 hypothetical protein HO173_000192 [Letharia columbiana]